MIELFYFGLTLMIMLVFYHTLTNYNSYFYIRQAYDNLVLLGTDDFFILKYKDLIISDSIGLAYNISNKDIIIYYGDIEMVIKYDITLYFNPIMFYYYFKIRKIIDTIDITTIDSI